MVVNCPRSEASSVSEGTIEVGVGRVPQAPKELIVGRYIDSLPASSARTLVLRRSGLALWDPAEVDRSHMGRCAHVDVLESRVRVDDRPREHPADGASGAALVVISRT